MKHFIQQSHRGRPLLLVALLVASAGAAKAQNATPPDVGTVQTRVTSIGPQSPIIVNTVATAYASTTATAGALGATLKITNDLNYGGYSRYSNAITFVLPKNTALPTQNQTSSVSGLMYFPGNLPGGWSAASTANLSAPGATTIISLSDVGFTVMGTADTAAPPPAAG